MTNTAIIVTLVTSVLLMAAPARADFAAEQSRISAPSSNWVGIETVSHPIRGTRTLQ